MRHLFQDQRYAARQLLHARAFTAIAVLTLALGIAGNTVFFAAVHAMVLRPIRATQTDGLYHLRFVNQRWGSHGPLTEARFRRLEADLPAAISRIGAVTGLRIPVVAAVPGRAERIDAEVVTSGSNLVLIPSTQWYRPEMLIVAERYLQSQRFGFMPNEISTWAAILTLIGLVGLAAAFGPARRASRVDPNVALREL